MENIKLKDGKIVIKNDYIKAKTRQLKDFGYENLEEKDVLEQCEKVLKGEDLDVIGMFIEDDILLDKQ